MKQFILGVLLFCPFISICQGTISYSYDNAGNRTGKTISSFKMDETLLSSDSTNISQNHGASYYTTVYPNPANEKIEIFTNELSLPYKYLLVDLSGKILVNGESSQNIKVINLTSYGKGTYILLLNDQFKELKYKIIKN